MTPSYASYEGVICVTLIYRIYIVSFAEYSLFYRVLLQKRPIILRSLLIVATLYCIASAAKETYDFIDPTNRSHPI